jgi:hypothetical protein
MKRSHPRGRAPSPFTLLNDEHQRLAVLKLADSRVSDHGIAQLIGWTVEDVRRVIAERAIEKAREASP